MRVPEASPAISMELVASLGQVPLLRDLPLSTLRDISLSTRKLQIDKGQFVFHDGRRPLAFFYVLSGQIKLGIASDEGEEKIIEIYSPGEAFGLAEIFSTLGHDSFAQATMRTALLQIGKAEFIQAVEREPLLCRRIVTWLADHASTLERDVATYCIHSARRRVLDFLLRLAGDSAHSGSRTIVTLDTRKRLIAARLSLTPETFSRALRDLAEAGLITVRGRHVTLEESLMARHASTAQEAPRGDASPSPHRRHSDGAVAPIGPDRPIGSRSWI
ncbi:MAG TPA: Crp/Fnr family transcriptional regulator [Azospira sp.]|nr:Crp/Fnr family transcriptional regulator [Azospira sp.]